MTPVSGVLAQGWGQYGHKVKMYYISENLFLYSHIYLKTKCMIMTSMRPSTTIVKFMTPGSGVQALVWRQYPGYKEA